MRNQDVIGFANLVFKDFCGYVCKGIAILYYRTIPNKGARILTSSNLIIVEADVRSFPKAVSETLKFEQLLSQRIMEIFVILGTI